jgi:hypothetical protein
MKMEYENKYPSYSKRNINVKLSNGEELNEPIFEMVSCPVIGTVRAGSKNILYSYDIVTQPERKKKIEKLRQRVRYFRFMTYIEILH